MEHLCINDGAEGFELVWAINKLICQSPNIGHKIEKSEPSRLFLKKTNLHRVFFQNTCCLANRRSSRSLWYANEKQSKEKEQYVTQTSSNRGSR